MMEHTATPWTWDWKLKHDSLEAECGIRHFDGNMSCSVARCPKYQSERQWKADARFIVTACNNFEEMYEALKAIKNTLEIALDEGSAGYIGHNLIVRDRLKALLNNTALLARIEGEK